MIISVGYLLARCLLDGLMVLTLWGSITRSDMAWAAFAG